MASGFSNAASCGFSHRLQSSIVWLSAGFALMGYSNARAQSFAEPGFSTQTVIKLSPYKPVGMTWAPDGRLFVWQEDGVVRIVKNGTLLSTPFLDIRYEVNTVNDRGLLGFALDPNFMSNGLVYLLYTYEEGGNPTDSRPKTSRLTRMQADPANPDVALSGSEIVLLGKNGIPPCSQYASGSDCIGSDGDSHTIGTLRFDKAGKLFVSIGDGASYTSVDSLALRSQYLNHYEGKILRINPDGSPVPDNPFYDGTNSIRSKVYSYGLRNPYRFALHPVSGEPFIADVGWSSFEEINSGRAANFGWPCYEGISIQGSYYQAFSYCQNLPAGSVTAPLYHYGRTQGRTAIAGTFYTSEIYPDHMKMNFFFADYSFDYIKRMVLDGQGKLVSVEPFMTNAAGPVAVELGPDGYLYYIAFETGEVRRIRYSGTPVVNVTASDTAGYSPLLVNFSSAGSFDRDGQPLTYLWTFDDGSTSSEPSPSHVYSAIGVKVFAASLTVTASTGLSSSASVRIVAGSIEPVATITDPPDGTLLEPGREVIFRGSAQDPDQILPSTALSWVVLLHHDDHVHPYLSAIGNQGSFVPEDHGGNYFYELVLTATDSTGLTDTKRRTLPMRQATWASSDIGNVGMTGNASYPLPGRVEVSGAGADIWGTADAFHFVRQPVSGDLEIIARIVSLSATDPWAKAGVMIRETVQEGARNIFMLLTLENGSALQRRLEPGANSYWTGGGGASTPLWVRLTREGNAFSGYRSSDGVTWTLVRTVTINMASSAYAGLAVTSHRNDELAGAAFDNVRLVHEGGMGPANTPPVVDAGPDQQLSPSATSTQLQGSVSDDGLPVGSMIDVTWSAVSGPGSVTFGNPKALVTSAGFSATGQYLLRLSATDGELIAYDDIVVTVQSSLQPPPDWVSGDVGSVGIPGNFSSMGPGEFEVFGSGLDIWGSADRFHFVRKTVSGDIEIIARISSLQRTDTWAKAGVMIRESLDPGSRHAFVLLTPDTGTAFERRGSTGWSTYWTRGGAGKAPYWVRLVRLGATFSGYRSSDGVTWTLVKTVTLSMNASVYAGLAVTSHNDNVLCRAVFDNVRIQVP